MRENLDALTKSTLDNFKPSVNTLRTGITLSSLTSPSGPSELESLPPPSKPKKLTSASVPGSLLTCLLMPPLTSESSTEEV